MPLSKNPELNTYWISFPKNPELPFGIGVTATSQQDAFSLIAQQGIGSWLKDTQEISIVTGVKIHDLDQKNVVPNIGPMQFRGVWYPVANIGYGAPRDSEYKPMNDK